MTLPINTTSVRFIDLVEGSLLLQLCKSVDIEQASEFLLRFEPFLSHIFLFENENIVAILSCNTTDFQMFRSIRFG